MTPTDQWHLTQQFDSGDGTVSFDVLGSGPPVVLVHGTPSSSYLWRHVAREMATRFTVYVYDLLGYGSSAKNWGQDVSIGAQTRILSALLDHWGLEQHDTSIVGHDIGGAIALRLLLLDQRQLVRVVLCDAVAIAPWITPFSRHVQRHLVAFQTVPEHIHRQMVATHLRTAIARDMSDDDLDPYLTPWLGEAGQEAYYRQVAQFDEEFTREIESRYGEIQTPVLVLWGDQDQWLDPRFGRQLTEMIPHAELVLIAGGGHFVPEDDPRQVTAALMDFLSSR